MSSQNQFKVSVVGCGHWGKNLVRNFAELGALEAVSDINKELVQIMSKQYKVPALSFEQVLKSDVQGVVIAAPAILHYELTKQALLANKHCFVEKPLALKKEHAQELCDLAKKQKKILMVGHLLQYHPAFVELKKLVAEGTLGTLQSVYSNRLSFGKVRTEENVLWSFAPHDISMVLELIEDIPEKIYATGASYLQPSIHDTVTLHTTFKNGVSAKVFVSWLYPIKEHKIVIVGDKGMAIFDDTLPWDKKLALYPHKIEWKDGAPRSIKKELVFISLEEKEPLKEECQHFIDCIQQGKRSKTDGFEGLRVVQVLEAAQKSLDTKTEIALESKSENYFKHKTAFVDEGSEIGVDTKIWHFSHILKGTKIGSNCVIGQNVMIGPDVVVGDNCKIQNNVSLYKGVVLEEGVFCGPSCVFTNVNNPRAQVERKDEFRPTYVEKGVTIGANATIICGKRLGAYSFIGAGAVVTKDVKSHALVVGTPAKQIGWVSHAGEKLGNDLLCPREGRFYRVDENENLKEVTKNDAFTPAKQTSLQTNQ
jgi:UDP-2-acetamido-3-amino-2,3-dideoxy-glucuronate N-acetyltransferase